ncbi:hypothetical protein ACUODJ_14785, partial [Escherichia sp. HC-CC]
ECTPYPRYGESDASVMAQIMSVVPQLEKGLAARAVVVIDENDNVIFSQLVDEITTEPDYEAALAVLKA